MESPDIPLIPPTLQCSDNEHVQESQTAPFTGLSIIQNNGKY